MQALNIVGMLFLFVIGSCKQSGQTELKDVVLQSDSGTLLVWEHPQATNDDPDFCVAECVDTEAVRAVIGQANRLDYSHSQRLQGLCQQIGVISKSDIQSVIGSSGVRQVEQKMLYPRYELGSDVGSILSQSLERGYQRCVLPEGIPIADSGDTDQDTDTDIPPGSSSMYRNRPSCLNPGEDAWCDRETLTVWTVSAKRVTRDEGISSCKAKGPEWGGAIDLAPRIKFGFTGYAVDTGQEIIARFLANSAEGQQIFNTVSGPDGATSYNSTPQPAVISGIRNPSSWYHNQARNQIVTIGGETASNARNPHQYMICGTEAREFSYEHVNGNLVDSCDRTNERWCSGVFDWSSKCSLTHLAYKKNGKVTIVGYPNNGFCDRRVIQCEPGSSTCKSNKGDQFKKTELGATTITMTTSQSSYAFDWKRGLGNVPSYEEFLSDVSTGTFQCTCMGFVTRHGTTSSRFYSEKTGDSANGFLAAVENALEACRRIDRSGLSGVSYDAYVGKCVRNGRPFATTPIMTHYLERNGMIRAQLFQPN